MNNFTFYNPTKINFGRGVESSVGEEIKSLGASKVLFHYGGGSIRKNGLYDRILDSLNKAGLHVIELGGVKPNPRLSLVKKGIELCKNSKVDFILAVGGGSVIDSAKAIALGVPYDGDVWDFFEGKSDIKEALPIGVITTLPSSGSETSNCSIISNGILKVGVESDLIIPKFAVMNPRFTMGLPPYQTSCGLADILSHLLERYFTDVENVDTTDYLIEGAVKALMLNAERLMMNPKDYNARAEVQWLASIAHNNLLDTGRISDWGSHRIEHELSAQYGITHGEGMSVVLVAWTHYMALNKPKKLAQLANRLYGIDYHNYTEKEMALILSKKLKEFFSSLNLKTTLSELNIGDKHFEEMALRATNNNTSTVGHYIPLDKNKFIDILHLAK